MIATSIGRRSSAAPRPRICSDRAAARFGALLLVAAALALLVVAFAGIVLSAHGDGADLGGGGTHHALRHQPVAPGTQGPAATARASASTSLRAVSSNPLLAVLAVGATGLVAFDAAWIVRSRTVAAASDRRRRSLGQRGPPALA